MADEKKIEIQLSDRSQICIISSADSGLLRMVRYAPRIGTDGREVMNVEGSSILSGPIVRAVRELFAQGTYIS